MSTRREFVASTLSLLSCTSAVRTAGTAPERDCRGEPKTFVLIHGSWHSAWNWFRVRPLLERLGHRVVAPDLPGMGRDRTPIHEVRFDTTVLGLCDLIDSVPGTVILVGHSKNGVLISQVAEHRPHKVEKLIYLAAVLAKDRRAAVDYFQLDTEEILGPHITNHPATGSSTLATAIYRDGLYHDCDADIVELAKVLLSHEPRQTATEPIRISQERYGSVRRFYIELTEDRAITPPVQRTMYEETPCERVYRMATGHSPFFSQPQQLVDIFVEIAGL